MYGVLWLTVGAPTDNLDRQEDATTEESTYIRGLDCLGYWRVRQPRQPNELLLSVTIEQDGSANRGSTSTRYGVESLVVGYKKRYA